MSQFVDGLSKLKTLRFESKEEESVANQRKMIISMAKDKRVMFIKLCDRLHNMRTISSMTKDKQGSIAYETVHIFAPIADRLGMRKVKDELEDLSWWCLDPIGMNAIKQETDARYGAARDLIDISQEKIKDALVARGIKFTCEGRTKTLASMYRKVFLQNKDYNDVFDYFALRYIVESIIEVYTVLGIVHDTYRYIQDRFKDYISLPKENGYKSVHTTVINENGIAFEVQIRTKEMHETAEFGIAAHWKYKTGEEADAKVTESFRWLASAVEADSDQVTSPEEFLSQIKRAPYAESVFVYTPKGEVKALPMGATAVDFAYMIHSNIGNKMVGVKINGKIMPIDTVLGNAQIVEIITANASKGPNRKWLDFVKTDEAKIKIKQWFKKEQRTENIVIGKEEVDFVFRTLAAQRHSYTDEQKAAIINNISVRGGYAVIDDFYNAVGFGGMQTSKLQSRIKDEAERLYPNKEPVTILNVKPVEFRDANTYSDNAYVVVDGVDSVLIKLSKCCNPLPGDDIRGFVTKGHGMSIHKADCKNFLVLCAKEDGDGRVFPAHWKDSPGAKSSKGGFKTKLVITAQSDSKLIPAIATMLGEMKVEIYSVMPVREKSDGTIALALLIGTHDTEHLNHIIHRLKTIKFVQDAERSVIM
ncbi:GTP pyrophosphokinase [Clostridia bacterium]|nr:GTP pyrophosphokinase [Clostridia bacterium]